MPGTSFKEKLRKKGKIYKILKTLKNFTNDLYTRSRFLFYRVSFKWKDFHSLAKNANEIIFFSERLVQNDRLNNDIVYVNLYRPVWEKYFVRFRLNPNYLAIFNNGEVVGRGGIIMDRNNNIIYESVLSNLRYFEYFRNDPVTVSQKHNQNIETIFEYAVSLINPIVTTYFHWLVETIPRILLIKKTCIEIWEKLIFIIPEKSPDFVFETLELFFGIGSDKLYLRQDQRIMAKKLVFPSYLHDRSSKYKISIYRDEVINELFLLGMNSLNLNKKYAQSELFIISRKNANKRKIENENKLEDRLSPFNVKCREIEKLSYKNEIELFYSASVVIGINGSGLSNIVYCRERTLVIELLPDRFADTFHSYFYQLTRIRRLNHVVIGISTYNDDKNYDKSMYDVILDDCIIDRIYNTVAEHLINSSC